MQVVLTGHAGMLVSAGGSTILCDPWFTPAYFGSWFPFPDNADVDVDLLSHPTYLYLSHLHQDHFDPRWLAEHVDRSTIVLLPDFPLPELRDALEALGFSRFVQTTSGRPVDLEGLRVAITTEVDPADGPLGDSALAVDDGTSRLFDQNDCRPRRPDEYLALGPYDLHLLQFSGAIWYPMAYRLDPEVKAALAREKRINQMYRAVRYIRAVDARHVVPFAGPPAFLDPGLFGLNDLDGDPANIFVDQAAFARYLADQGVVAATLTVPGTVLDLDASGMSCTHPAGADAVAAIYRDKRAYLAHYQERRREQIVAAEPPSRPETGRAADLIAALARWVEPLLVDAPRVRRHLGGPIVIDVGTFGVLIDPAGGGRVGRWEGEAWEHYFAVDEALVRSLVERHVVDWVNELFLSCRFEAARSGGYNPTVFALFKCLSASRMAYLEASLSAPDGDGAGADASMWRFGDYLVQRRCPHLGGDLARFGEVADGVLTCTLHGWQFELGTGRCLTAGHAGLITCPSAG